MIDGSGSPKETRTFVTSLINGLLKREQGRASSVLCFSVETAVLVIDHHARESNRKDKRNAHDQASKKLTDNNTLKEKRDLAVIATAAAAE